MHYLFQEKSYRIERYPGTQNRSLQAWNAADELLLEYYKEQEEFIPERPILYHDRFGFLACCLSDKNPINVVNYKSQEKAILHNFKNNTFNADAASFISPLSSIEMPINVVLMQVPKTLDLFRLYLHQISKAASAQTVVVCGFMTKYFSPQMLEIAATYFGSVEQSRAKKKARLLILRQALPFNEKPMLKHIKWEEKYLFQQYFGVFSSNQVDIGTRFLLAHLPQNEQIEAALDLACGNGILAWALKEQNEIREMHLIDDDVLAIASAQLNLDNKGNYFHHNDTLSLLPKKHFDWIISNPPFHFEHETTIEISLSLFKQAKELLRTGGIFRLVANKHLNYKTHLQQIFHRVEIVAENEKFIIYDCSLS